jgi:hypothetical protein
MSINRFSGPDHESASARNYSEHEDRAGQIEPIQYPDFSALDSLTDRIRDMISEGKDIEELAAEILEGNRMALLSELLVKFLFILRGSNDLKRDILILSSLAGLDECEGKSKAEIARSLGLSRQNYCARENAILAKLGMEITRPRDKTEKSVNEYRAKNARRASHET